MKESLFEQTFKKHARLLKDHFGSAVDEFPTAQAAIDYCYERALSPSLNAGEEEIQVDNINGRDLYTVWVAGNDGENETEISFRSRDEAVKFIAHFK